MTTYDALIVGAGFAGIGAAIQLKRNGYDNLLIVERESDLGGTWHVNRYPGLAVDIPSATYSYAFEQNARWSRLFAPGRELKQYALDVADKYDVRRHMQFDTTVTGACWDEDEQHWVVATDRNDQVSARFLVAATGFLSMPKLPEIDGINGFTGSVVHTADWDDDIALRNKRIAIIGTGATAVQLIPELAKKAKRLTVFQRTPIWVAPRPDVPIPGPVRSVFAALPVVQRAARLGSTSVIEAISAGAVNYETAQSVIRAAEAVCRAHLRLRVHDPLVRAKLTPDYDFGCKRPSFSNDYLSTFNQAHVDLETTTISHVDGSDIVTIDGNRREVDVLVLATGFSLWEQNFPAFEILGRDGRDLGKWWRDNRFQAYEGITVPAFPNLLSLSAPYGFVGLSFFFSMETHMRHMDRLFGAMAERNATTFEVTEEANQRFLDKMLALGAKSVFAQGNCASANSYYFNHTGDAPLLRPQSALAAQRSARTFPLADYAFSGSSPTANER